MTETNDLKVCVVSPMPSDPPWELFDEIPDDIPIIVPDDSDGNLAPAPRDNVTYFDYAAQKEYCGEHYDAMPHKSAASRNFGHQPSGYQHDGPWRHGEVHTGGQIEPRRAGRLVGRHRHGGRESMDLHAATICRRRRAPACRA